jgi:hypothetical protein
MPSNGLTMRAVDLLLCARTMVQEAGRFGGIGDTLSPGPVNGSGTAFGTLLASGRLAGLVADVNTAASSQFSVAEKFLRGTELALDQAEQNVVGTDSAIAAQAASIAGTITHAEQELG